MIEAIGDLWTHPAEFRCITTNGVVTSQGYLVMGAGVALQAKKRFPNLPKKLGSWVKQYGNRAFLCRDEGLLTFPTKNDWRHESTLSLISQSASQVLAIVNKYGLKSIVMTRPGCGNGRLEWEEVKPTLQFLDDRFTVISGA